MKRMTHEEMFPKTIKAIREAMIDVATMPKRTPLRPMYAPADCPHCEYDRRFPGFEGGGWIQQDNNGPIVSCPMCNDDGSHLPRGEA